MKEESKLRLGFHDDDFLQSRPYVGGYPFDVFQTNEPDVKSCVNIEVDVMLH